MLENTLNLHRSELVAAVDADIPGQTLRRRGTNLVSTHPGRSAPRRLAGPAVGGDPSFHVAKHETLAQVIAEYAAACASSGEIAAAHTLDDTAHHALVGTVSLRFIYLGMIGEVAHHAGHADLLTEQIRKNAEA